MNSNKKYKIKIFRRNRKVYSLPIKLSVFYIISIIIIWLIWIFKFILISERNIDNRYNSNSVFLWVYFFIIFIYILCQDIKWQREKKIPMLEESQNFIPEADQKIRQRLEKNKYDINYMYTNSLFKVIACKTNIIIARIIPIITLIAIYITLFL